MLFWNDLARESFHEKVSLIILTEDQKLQIVELFRPIMQRNRLPLEQELESADRITFENTLMEIYGISENYEPIKNSLKQLYRIRFAVKD